MSSNSFSVITVTPNSCAFVSFEPASSPANTYDVFLDTEDDVFPPYFSIKSSASFLVYLLKAPVNTKAFPSKH